MIIEKIIKKNFDLTFYNTFRLYSRAEFFVVVKNEKELIQAISWARVKNIPVLFLAGGSNILINRKKIKGLIVKISGEKYSCRGNFISAWAGTGLTRLAKISSDLGLAGLEWAFGIPGGLGGAVRGNAGAYGSDISKSVVEVEAYDLAKNKKIKLSNKACGFGYRHSIFKENKNLLILNVKLKFKRTEPEKLKKLPGKTLIIACEPSRKNPAPAVFLKICSMLSY